MSETVPTLFEQDFTKDRQIESWNSLPEDVRRNQLGIVRWHLSFAREGLTSRELAMLTGIDRTSITRVLSDNKDDFDCGCGKIDPRTRKRVTVYRLK